MPTSDNVLLHLLRRSLAFLYDALLLIALYFIVTAVLLVFTDGRSIQHPLFYIGLWLLGGVFFTSFWRHGGQTLGMRAWQLRLVDDTERDADGRPSSRAIDRTRLWQRYLIGTSLFGIGFAWALFDPRSRTAADRLTRTLVTRDADWLRNVVAPG